MTRVVDTTLPDTPVDATPVAEHRYRWDAPFVELKYETSDDVYTRYRNQREAFMKTIPYHVGDVVWVESHRRDYSKYARRARILHVFIDRNDADLREKYRVQFETADGRWSKVWTYVFPGHIQRGYQLAGLAPEIPDGE